MHIAMVRRFNRLVSERIGALDDRYLSRERSLGEARLLWEIGASRAGEDVRALRARLGLDSGYTSRLLAALRKDGLIEVVASPGDRRVRVARLTRAGAAERRVLDRRSDALAAALLAPLDDAQRRRLVEAMAVVEKLLTAPLVAVTAIDPEHPDAAACLRAYYAELATRFDAGFDPGRFVTTADDLRPPRGVFLVARLRGRVVGCGGLAGAEIRKMWVAPEARGLGVARRLLGALEAEARRRRHEVVRLDTNGALLEAIAMYRGAGYLEVPRFNDNPYAHHWFEKRLTAAPRRAARAAAAARPRRPARPPRSASSRRGS